MAMKIMLLLMNRTRIYTDLTDLHGLF